MLVSGFKLLLCLLLVCLCLYLTMIGSFGFPTISFFLAFRVITIFLVIAVLYENVATGFAVTDTRSVSQGRG
ncbi:MAG: hypothetical protein VB120_00560 [Lachnospiraceae bacterium]|nr:hypothetical protein [Lachnospiraceae bacterium]